MTAGKTFTEHFIIAVSKMAVDAAPEVRWLAKCCDILWLVVLVKNYFCLLRLHIAKSDMYFCTGNVGRRCLRDFHQKDFFVLLDKFVPIKDRHFLDKILKKMRE